MVNTIPNEIRKDGRLHYIYRYLVDSLGVRNTVRTGIYLNTSKLGVPGYFKRVFKDRDKVLTVKAE